MLSARTSDPDFVAFCHVFAAGVTLVMARVTPGACLLEELGFTLAELTHCDAVFWLGFGILQLCLFAPFLFDVRDHLVSQLGAGVDGGGSCASSSTSIDRSAAAEGITISNDIEYHENAVDDENEKLHLARGPAECRPPAVDQVPGEDDAAAAADREDPDPSSKLKHQLNTTINGSDDDLLVADTSWSFSLSPRRTRDYVPTSLFCWLRLPTLLFEQEPPKSRGRELGGSVGAASTNSRSSPSRSAAAPSSSSIDVFDNPKYALLAAFVTCGFIQFSFPFITPTTSHSLMLLQGLHGMAQGLACAACAQTFRKVVFCPNVTCIFLWILWATTSLGLGKIGGPLVTESSVAFAARVPEDWMELMLSWGGGGTRTPEDGEQAARGMLLQQGDHVEREISTPEDGKASSPWSFLELVQLANAVDHGRRSAAGEGSGNPSNEESHDFFDRSVWLDWDWSRVLFHEDAGITVGGSASSSFASPGPSHHDARKNRANLNQNHHGYNQRKPSQGSDKVSATNEDLALAFLNSDSTPLEEQVKSKRNEDGDHNDHKVLRSELLLRRQANRKKRREIQQGSSTLSSSSGPSENREGNAAEAEDANGLQRNKVNRNAVTSTTNGHRGGGPKNNKHDPTGQRSADRRGVTSRSSFAANTNPSTARRHALFHAPFVSHGLIFLFQALLVACTLQVPKKSKAERGKLMFRSRRRDETRCAGERMVGEETAGALAVQDRREERSGEEARAICDAGTGGAHEVRKEELTGGDEHGVVIDQTEEDISPIFAAAEETGAGRTPDQHVAPDSPTTFPSLSGVSLVPARQDSYGAANYPRSSRPFSPTDSASYRMGGSGNGLSSAYHRPPRRLYEQQEHTSEETVFRNDSSVSSGARSSFENSPIVVRVEGGVIRVVQKADEEGVEAQGNGRGHSVDAGGGADDGSLLSGDAGAPPAAARPAPAVSSSSSSLRSGSPRGDTQNPKKHRSSRVRVDVSPPETGPLAPIYHMPDNDPEDEFELHGEEHSSSSSLLARLRREHEFRMGKLASLSAHDPSPAASPTSARRIKPSDEKQDDQDHNFSNSTGTKEKDLKLQLKLNPFDDADSNSGTTSRTATTNAAAATSDSEADPDAIATTASSSKLTASGGDHRSDSKKFGIPLVVPDYLRDTQRFSFSSAGFGSVAAAPGPDHGEEAAHEPKEVGAGATTAPPGPAHDPEQDAVSSTTTDPRRARPRHFSICTPSPAAEKLDGSSSSSGGTRNSSEARYSSSSSSPTSQSQSSHSSAARKWLQQDDGGDAERRRRRQHPPGKSSSPPSSTARANLFNYNTRSDSCSEFLLRPGEYPDAEGEPWSPSPVRIGGELILAPEKRMKHHAASSHSQYAEQEVLHLAASGPAALQTRCMGPWVSSLCISMVAMLEAAYVLWLTFSFPRGVGTMFLALHGVGDATAGPLLAWLIIWSSSTSGTSRAMRSGSRRRRASEDQNVEESKRKNLDFRLLTWVLCFALACVFVFLLRIEQNPVGHDMNAHGHGDLHKKQQLQHDENRNHGGMGISNPFITARVLTAITVFLLGVLLSSIRALFGGFVLANVRTEQARLQIPAFWCFGHFMGNVMVPLVGVGFPLSKYSAYSAIGLSCFVTVVMSGEKTSTTKEASADSGGAGDDEGAGVVVAQNDVC